LAPTPPRKQSEEERNGSISGSAIIITTRARYESTRRHDDDSIGRHHHRVTDKPKPSPVARATNLLGAPSELLHRFRAGGVGVNSRADAGEMTNYELTRARETY